MYIIKKAVEYFFPVIQKGIYTEALTFLSSEEKEIFDRMAEYDKTLTKEI